MSYNYETPDDWGGQSGRLNTEGVFHVVVNAVREGLSPGGKPTNGFTIDVQVLAGDCQGQTASLLFSDPQHSQKDSGAFCRRKIGRLLIAGHMLDPNTLGMSGPVDLQQLVGTSFVIEMKLRPDSQYVDLNYDSIWHVDDPRLTRLKWEPDQAMIAEIPSQYRRSAEWFAPLVKGKPKAAAPQQKLDVSSFDL